MKKTTVSIFCAILLSNIAIAADIDWPAKTAQVIDLIYDSIKAHHPGMLDKNNPNFLEDLFGDYNKALIRAKTARSANALIAISEEFAHNDFRKTAWRRPGIAPENHNQSIQDIPAKARIEIRDDSIEALFPTFRTNSDNDGQEISDAIASLKKRLEKYKNKTLIINFTGNNALGSSRWGNEIFKAVWGQRIYDILKSQEKAKRYYRVTPENSAHMKDIIKRPMPEEYKKIFMEIANKMEQVLLRGDIKELLEYEEGNIIIHDELPSINFPVYIYTDGQISRAVRPFLSLALKAGAKLIGDAIPACSPYAEIRDIEIYDGHKLLLPIVACFDDTGAYQPTQQSWR